MAVQQQSAASGFPHVVPGEDPLYELRELPTDGRHGWAYACPPTAEVEPHEWSAEDFQAVARRDLFYLRPLPERDSSTFAGADPDGVDEPVGLIEFTGWHDMLRHFVITFHDEMLECLARDLRTEIHWRSLADTLAATTRRMLGTR